MKYTVVIRQPVPDEVRPKLEKELVERFGLNEQQAERLASRRAGRLLKPTTQARADLLLRVYQSVGAQVLMEEIPEESDTPSQAFSVTAPVDDAVLAPPMQNNTSMADFTQAGATSMLPGADAFSPVTPSVPGGTFTPSDDPFAASFAPPAAESLPDWAQNSLTARDPNIPPDNNPEVNLMGGLNTPLPDATTRAAAASEAAIARELKGAGAKTPVADDWADFAGGLNLPETAAPATPARASTEFLTAVTEDAPSVNLPRTSLTNQILWGSLLPVGISSLLTLGLLGLTIPGQQNRNTLETAHNLAAMTGTSLDNGLQAVNEFQLATLIANPDVNFARVELPGGKSYVRSKNPKQNDELNKKLAEWTKTNPDGGKLNIAGQTYMISRVTFVNGNGGQGVTAVPSSANAQGDVVRRVTVGMSNNTNTANLRRLFLLTLLATGLGLLIASLLARQAAQRIVQPISDLVKAADAISLGDLTRPVKVNTNDELGDLGQSLERMRLSLEAAMDRLRRRKR